MPDEPLPFLDGAFDLVLCVETIEHVRDVQLLLSEVRRVLRPDGTLALTTPAHGRLTALRALWNGFEAVFDPLSPHLRFFTGARWSGCWTTWASTSRRSSARRARSWSQRGCMASMPPRRAARLSWPGARGMVRLLAPPPSQPG